MGVSDSDQTRGAHYKRRFLLWSQSKLGTKQLIQGLCGWLMVVCSGFPTRTASVRTVALAESQFEAGGVGEAQAVLLRWRFPCSRRERMGTGVEVFEAPLSSPIFLVKMVLVTLLALVRPLPAAQQNRLCSVLVAELGAGPQGQEDGAGSAEECLVLRNSRLAGFLWANHEHLETPTSTSAFGSVVKSPSSFLMKIGKKRSGSVLQRRMGRKRRETTR